MTDPGAVRVYLFDTTNLAMWAEEVALEHGVPAEVVAAPPGARDKCGLALRTLERHGAALEAALDTAGVGYHRLEDVVEGPG